MKYFLFSSRSTIVNAAKNLYFLVLEMFFFLNVHLQFKLLRLVYEFRVRYITNKKVFCRANWGI